jgi:2-dehydropantoate 2-reductase
LRIAVIGSGAIGGVIAAAALAAGHDVTICVRTPIDSLVVDSGDDCFEIRSGFATEPASVAPVDLVFLTVKAVDTASAAGWLAALSRPGTVVAAAQNGLDHAGRLAPYLTNGVEAIPALAYIGAERVAPGRVRRYRGDLLVAPAGPSDLVSEAVSPALSVRASTDIVTDSWQKLLGNLIANPLTALTMRRIDVIAEPAIAELARGILREAVAVGRAEGADLSEDLVEAFVVGSGRYGDEVGSSMLYDRLAGRPLEHQYLTGEVVRRAATHGIPVPLNSAVLALLDALDRSR